MEQNNYEDIEESYIENPIKKWTNKSLITILIISLIVGILIGFVLSPQLLKDTIEQQNIESYNKGYLQSYNDTLTQLIKASKENNNITINFGGNIVILEEVKEWKDLFVDFVEIEKKNLLQLEKD